MVICEAQEFGCRGLDLDVDGGSERQRAETTRAWAARGHGATPGCAGAGRGMSNCICIYGREIPGLIVTMAGVQRRRAHTSGQASAEGRDGEGRRSARDEGGRERCRRGGAWRASGWRRIGLMAGKAYAAGDGGGTRCVKGIGGETLGASCALCEARAAERGEVEGRMQTVIKRRKRRDHGEDEESGWRVRWVGLEGGRRGQGVQHGMRASVRVGKRCQRRLLRTARRTRTRRGRAAWAGARRQHRGELGKRVTSMMGGCEPMHVACNVDLLDDRNGGELSAIVASSHLLQDLPARADTGRFNLGSTSEQIKPSQELEQQRESDMEVTSRGPNP
ncbi:hypothetical protein DFH09DRAFT_1112642 [Mycena vulgaris]|nr:hypothetical protein DFH09DRAFT_1112642 [Mycena vulgaris]